ncbi:uncharacterized protein L969DRAFT_93017 [Mixia osmundae IAM 14324]|uniref:Uncharacterized protein n=1 Tax=Mixia osmundae (strain CBS 9802 / IAM 14324 / JCM 22182 / KY 12970) TaxID=764103 RepID=G7E6C8_MIXOS|nr:uncharacterized protein L969DRAFT_93017 [Mixia osmundae IAM 14324]KEI40455.1 hypothetical protein L969DRAFT_93017 [Mixia osmundae IAM 14324]GAA98388.1 hypothetical protein E5Q_05074 [Mixia osmundae IAM 14324]
MPVPSEELPILEALVNIRNRLTALKKDRSEYVRAQDVLNIFSAVIKQVTKLNDLRDTRDAKSAAADSSTTSSGSPSSASAPADFLEPDQANRLDTTLNDVFQLLSLFFLTIGKSRESPASYCQLATMKQLLDHMNESGIYTENDLAPFQTRLTELREIIVSSDNPAALTKLLLKKHNDCQKMVDVLVKGLSRLSHELVPIHQRLITIRRQLAAIYSKPTAKMNKADIEVLKEELRTIDSKRVDGKFLGPGGSSVPEGQALLAGILSNNFDLCEEIAARGEDVAPPLKLIYDRLSEMRAQLERLTLTHRWTLRETDLYNYQISLQEIDSMRVDGRFVDSEGNKPDGQLVLLYLLRRCYGLIYRLMASSEPIAEELMPIANKLSTVKRCLTELSRYGGPYSTRDLYPYQLALSQIDAIRVDGKFMGASGDVPEGQAILHATMSECHEIIQSLKEEMEQQQGEEERGVLSS